MALTEEMAFNLRLLGAPTRILLQDLDLKKDVNVFRLAPLDLPISC